MIKRIIKGSFLWWGNTSAVLDIIRRNAAGNCLGDSLSLPIGRRLTLVISFGSRFHVIPRGCHTAHLSYLPASPSPTATRDEGALCHAISVTCAALPEALYSSAFTLAGSVITHFTTVIFIHLHFALSPFELGCLLLTLQCVSLQAVAAGQTSSSKSWVSCDSASPRCVPIHRWNNH